MGVNLLLDYANWDGPLMGTWDSVNGWYHVNGNSTIFGCYNGTDYVARYNGVVNTGDYLDYTFTNNQPVTLPDACIWYGTTPCPPDNSSCFNGMSAPFTAGDTVYIYLQNSACCIYQVDGFIVPNSSPPPTSVFWTDFIGCHEAST